MPRHRSTPGALGEPACSHTCKAPFRTDNGTVLLVGDSITAGYFPDVAGILDGRAPAASCYDAGHTGGKSSIAGVILGRFGSGDGWCGARRSTTRAAARLHPSHSPLALTFSARPLQLVQRAAHSEKTSGSTVPCLVKQYWQYYMRRRGASDADYYCDNADSNVGDYFGFWDG